MSNGLISQDTFLDNYRNKYPEYGAVDDSTLLDAIFKKHPQYKDQVELAEPEPEFDPQGDSRDYKANEMLGTDDMGWWGSADVAPLDRDPESGRMLIGTNQYLFWGVSKSGFFS